VWSSIILAFAEVKEAKRDMAPVTFSVNRDGVGVLTMNRPHARNALTWEAMHAFAKAVQAAQAALDHPRSQALAKTALMSSRRRKNDPVTADSSSTAVLSTGVDDGNPMMRALIVTGADGAFCSGGDLIELDKYPSQTDGARLGIVMGEALDQLAALPIPTVAAVEGPAIGGGAEIALACDLRVLAEGSLIGLTHARLGIIPAWGGGQRLLRLVGYSKALEWLASGRMLSAAEAYTAGLANRLVPAGQALAEALQLAKSFVERAATAVRAVKELLRAGISLPAEDAAMTERSLFPDLWAASEHLQASASFVARKNHKPRRD